MPRASWKGFLRLSLVSCPVYLAPATTRTKAVRLHQVWVPTNESRPAKPADVAEEQDQPRIRGGDHDNGAGLARTLREREELDDTADIEPLDEPAPATRIGLRPHDPHTGEEVDRAELRKGYEYQRGRFVTFTPAELKSLDVESSHTIDLTSFVPRADVDPIYFNAAYYLYPDRDIAVEPYRVISAALAEAGMVGIGRLTLSRRERMVLVEPRGPGMALITLRAADEVRAADFTGYEGDIDAESVAIATMIIKRKLGTFDPTTFRDRYQDALGELVEAKVKGLSVGPQPATSPAPVLDLMTALKRSLAQENAVAATPRRKVVGDKRQRNLLLPVAGSGRKQPALPPAEAAVKRRRKA